MTTTLCWNCDKSYAFDAEKCPHCGATNGNFDLERAAKESEAREQLIKAAITKATGAHRVLNAYDYEDVFACCEAVLAAGVAPSLPDGGPFGRSSEHG